jgi:hypothetical protein
MLNYPLELSFKIATIGTRVRVVDAAGRQIAYLRKKKFRLKEDVRVYEEEDLLLACLMMVLLLERDRG